MKITHIGCFVLLSFTLQAQKAKVSFPITYTQPYCGGARPSEEQIKASETPRPYANAAFVILHENGKVDSAKTDKDGLLKLKLRAGSYKVCEAWRYRLYTPNNLPISSFDKTCLRNEWEKVAYTLEVSKKKFQVKPLDPITNYCDWALPCLIESGPVPPM
jgi:hypothetical protein